MFHVTEMDYWMFSKCKILSSRKSEILVYWVFYRNFHPNISRIIMKAWNMRFKHELTYIA